MRTDDLGHDVGVPTDVRRVVSLVPSLTESLAVTGRSLLVGATDWCTHPGDLDVARVVGTKNPDVAAVLALEPDLVLANAEENREGDLDTLRENGLSVWVTDVRTVDGAFTSLSRMLAACGLPHPTWLDDAERAWDAVRPVAPRRRAVVPIWRRPWMAVGSDTFTGDVLRRLGVDNVLDESPERYPRFDPAGIPAHDLVVLPTEPYEFSISDGPEAFPAKESAVVSGRHVTWYGPSMVEAATLLGRQLGQTVTR